MSVPSAFSIPSASGIGIGVRAGSTGIDSYASGTPNVGENKIAVVGENPYKEIVIGSKINNGVAMNLSKGSGVVNAKSTSTLSGILNNLGDNNLMSKAMGSNITNSNMTNDKTVINNFNVTANVQDGKGLVDYLQNFGNQMTQKAFGY